jgi:hypothetical protein
VTAAAVDGDPRGRSLAARGRFGILATMHASLRLLTLASLFTLACKPGPGGDDTTESTGSTAETAGTTVGASETTAGEGPTTSTSTSTSTSTGTGDGTSGDTSGETTAPTSTGPDPVTTGDVDCATIPAQSECDATRGCQSVVGLAQEFVDCAPGEHFLGCIAAQPCDAVIVTVCRDDSDEVYEVGGCLPESGFSPCAGPGAACPDGVTTCEEITTFGECVNNQCRVVLAAPHIEVDGETCASYGDDEEFLGCIEVDAACVDDTIILCPIGMDAPNWDSASGCVPPGFESCAVPPVPACP